MSPCKTHVIFDYDLTLVPHESVDVIIRDALRNTRQPAVWMEKLEAIAPRLQNGKASLKDWWTLLRALNQVKREHLYRYVEFAAQQMDPVLSASLDELRADGVELHLLSCAYLEWLKPLAEHWGFPAENIMGGRLVWQGNRALAFRPSPLLFGNKVKVVEAWKQAGKLDGKVIMVGDSSTDAKVWQAGYADHFVCADYFTARPFQVGDQAPPGLIRVGKTGELLCGIRQAMGKCRELVPA